jgi:hypothetical protein
MNQPDYKRPFDQQDFRGYFTWDTKVSRALKQLKLYHACHPEELGILLENEELNLRSSWKLQLPEHGIWEIPGVWVGLNYFHNGNRYGPIVIEFPIDCLEKRKFMVFRRTGERQRYFFVQYESLIPIYSFKEELWRKINVRSYFDEQNGNEFIQKRGAIYDIVLTVPLKIKGAKFDSINHPKCISGKCTGMSKSQGGKILKKITIKHIEQKLFDRGITSKILERFPFLEGSEIKLSEYED